MSVTSVAVLRHRDTNETRYSGGHLFSNPYVSFSKFSKKMFSWKKDGAQRVPRIDMDLLLPAGHICMNPRSRHSLCAALMSGCCLATLKLRVIGDGEPFGERVRLKWSGGECEVKGLHRAEVKQLLLWEYSAVLSDRSPDGCRRSRLLPETEQQRMCISSAPPPSPSRQEMRRLG